MFAPDPPVTSGWWVIEANATKDDLTFYQVNLFENYCSQYPFGYQEKSTSHWLWGGAYHHCDLESYSMSFEKPSGIIQSKTYKNDRWRKFLMNMRIGKFQHFSGDYLAFLREQWDEKKHGKLLNLRLYWVTYPIPPPYSENRTIKSHPLLIAEE